MIRCSALLQKAFWPILVVQSIVAACSSDSGFEPGPGPGLPPDMATTGRIEVTLSSDRSGFDVGVTVEGAGTWTLQPNEELRIEQLVPGRYVVRIVFLEAARKAGLFCHVREGNERAVLVRAGATAPVQYQIDCGTTSGRPRQRKVE